MIRTLLLLSLILVINNASAQSDSQTIIIDSCIDKKIDEGIIGKIARPKASMDTLNEVLNKQLGNLAFDYNADSLSSEFTFKVLVDTSAGRINKISLIKGKGMVSQKIMTTLKEWSNWHFERDSNAFIFPELLLKVTIYKRDKSLKFYCKVL